MAEQHIGLYLCLLSLVLAGRVSADVCYSSSGSSISCPGIYDNYDESYCCGSNYKYCCDYSDYSTDDYYSVSTGANVAAVIGGVISGLILLCIVISIVVCCCIAARRSTGTVVGNTGTANPVFVTTTTNMPNNQQRAYVTPAAQQPYPTVQHQPAPPGSNNYQAPPVVTGNYQPPPSYTEVIAAPGYTPQKQQQVPMQSPQTPLETAAPVFTPPPTTAPSDVHNNVSPTAPRESMVYFGNNNP